MTKAIKRRVKRKVWNLGLEILALIIALAITAKETWKLRRSQRDKELLNELRRKAAMQK